MDLLTTQQREQMLFNGRLNLGDEGRLDLKPVVKLVCPWDESVIWLLTEIAPDDEDAAFGLCDLGIGLPVLGYVSLSELAGTRGPDDLRIFCDSSFTPTQTLRAFAEEAQRHGYIDA